jgi:hypothetical protein
MAPAGDADGPNCGGARFGKCGPGLACLANRSDPAVLYCAPAVGAGAACDFGQNVCDPSAGIHCDYEKHICVPPGDAGSVCTNDDFVLDCAEGLDCYVETGANVGHCRVY